MVTATERAPAASAQVGNLGDTIFKGLCTTAALMVVAVSVLLVVIVFDHSWLSIRTFGLSFFTGTNWDPEPTHAIFQGLAFIFGTLVTSGLAMLIAVPLGIGTAAFLSEIAPE